MAQDNTRFRLSRECNLRLPSASFVFLQVPRRKRRMRGGAASCACQRNDMQCSSNEKEKDPREINLLTGHQKESQLLAPWMQEELSILTSWRNSCASRWRFAAWCIRLGCHRNKLKRVWYLRINFLPAPTSSNQQRYESERRTEEFRSSFSDSLAPCSCR